MDLLLREVPDAWLSVSSTTRNPRPGEQDGVHYHFLTDENFDKLIAEHGFLEWAQVHDHKYGTSRAAVEKAMSEGKQVILEIDVQGAQQVRNRMPDAHFIFIEPPSLKELERRLRNRGTETEDVIIKRMNTAKDELSHKMEYDIQLVNDNLDETCSQLIAYVNSFADAKKDN